MWLPTRAAQTALRKASKLSMREGRIGCSKGYIGGFSAQVFWNHCSTLGCPSVYPANFCSNHASGEEEHQNKHHANFIYLHLTPNLAHVFGQVGGSSASPRGKPTKSAQAVASLLKVERCSDQAGAIQTSQPPHPK